jgi:hypothetical protein
MAPLPPENTARFWVDYSDGNHPHTLLLRYSPSAGLSAIQAVAAEFLAALSTDLYLLTITGARAAASGSVVSVPEAWGGDATYGSAAQPPASAPLQLCFVGRTTFGRIAKWFMYGFKGVVPDSYRFFPGDDSVLDAAVTILRNAALTGKLLAIDGELPSVYPYVNIQFNSYWETQARR